MFQRNRKSGFTLLELLIVVIIVSILAAVALPRFGRMTRKARSSEAANAIGSLLTAEALYYQEHGVFTATRANLLVDVNETNFTYTLSGASGTGVTATAAGRVVTTTGITVTGVITDTGTRTITTTGV